MAPGGAGGGGTIFGGATALNGSWSEKIFASMSLRRQGVFFSVVSEVGRPVYFADFWVRYLAR